MKWVLLLIGALAALAVGFGLRARSANWEERLDFLEAELGGLVKAREQTGRRAWPRPTEAHEVRDSPGTAGADGATDALAARIAALQEFLREVEWRAARTHARVPSEEEFKRQLERGRVEGARLNRVFVEKGEIALRIARALRPGVEEKNTLEPGVSSILEANAEFVAAREAMMRALAEMSDFSNRIAPLLTMDRSGRDLMRDSESIARTRQELAEEFKSARRDYVAATQELRDTQSAGSSKRPSGNEGLAEFTVKNSLAIMAAMETQLAELEFAETIGPLRRNW